MNHTLTKLLVIKGFRDKHSELSQAILKLENKTRKESGCINCFSFQSLSDKNIFLLLEVFADQKSFNAHILKGYTMGFFTKDVVKSVEAIDILSEKEIVI